MRGGYSRRGRWVSVPSISAQKRNGNIVGFSVYFGTEGDQRRQRKFFVHRSEAEKFVAQQTTTPVPVVELWERKAEILRNLVAGLSPHVRSAGNPPPRRSQVRGDREPLEITHERLAAGIRSPALNNRNHARSLVPGGSHR